MEELHVADDQSHYEISLTAGQAFAAFVLLLLSLAASFAFGLMIGKGQADDRLVVQKETPVVTEAALAPRASSDGRIVELGVADDDFQESAPAGQSAEPSAASPVPAIVEESSATAPSEGASSESSPSGTGGSQTAAVTELAPESAPAAAPVAPVAPAPRVTTYAQLLSTSDQKTAEALAVRLINRGYSAAYVERGSTEKGPVFRVRVRFNSEAEARAAEPKLKEFSSEVWITTR